MPQIIVTADRRPDRGDGAVMLRERVTVNDFESDHFVVHLLERLGWAVGDAHEVERQARDETTAEVERQAPEASADTLERDAADAVREPEPEPVTS